MDIQDIFTKIFFWMNIVDVQLTNAKNWKTKLLNCFLIWNILVSALHVLVLGYYIIFRVKDIHELAECIPPYVTLFDLVVKLVNFHVQRNCGVELIDSLMKFMKTGMIQTVLYKFNFKNFSFFNILIQITKNRCRESRKT